MTIPDYASGIHTCSPKDWPENYKTKHILFGNMGDEGDSMDDGGTGTKGAFES